MNLLITGATGFVGSALVNFLVNHSSFAINVAVRDGSFLFPSSVRVFEIGDLGSPYDWSTVLPGISVVIHAAGRVHIQPESVAGSLAEFRRVNVAGTLNLARQAQKAGVQRFIYISSVKVNGEETHQDSFFSAGDQPVPTDPYAISKMEAEQGLQQLASETGLEVVIIRPPLVYGAGVKANFLSMMNWLNKGLPLPLGAINNKRSFVALGNLVDLVVTCIDHPAAANQIFLVSDDENLSTTELLRRLAKAMGKNGCLIPVPVDVLKLGAAIFGKRTLARRLCGSLQVDISKTREVLGWTPPLSVDDGLKRAAGEYQDGVMRYKNSFVKKRLFDILISFAALGVLSIPLFIVAALVKLTSRGSVLYWSDRVGKNNILFKMPKFRTMMTDTPAVATHLLDNPDRYLTQVGHFLRKTSLDELPQIISILKGDMSLVGPRPALYNQDDLVTLRTEKGVHMLTPGLTGWAQINGRDELPIPAKVDLDTYYLHHQSFKLDMQILVKTFLYVVKSDGVSH